MTARLKLIEGGQSKRIQPHDPAHRGLVVVYRRDQVNHCPGCGRTNWYLGRLGAECAFCCLALHYGESNRG